MSPARPGVVAVLLAAVMIGGCGQGGGAPTAPSDTTSPGPQGLVPTSGVSAGATGPDAAIPMAELPDVGLPVDVNPDERFAYVVQCLEDQGFGATAEYYGMVPDSVPVEQAPVLNAAAEACQAKYPFPPEMYEPPSRGQLNLLYDYLSDRATPCLEAQGVAVPPAPSRDVFVDAGDDYIFVWDIYSLAGTTPDQYYEECPPRPPWDQWIAAK